MNEGEGTVSIGQYLTQLSSHPELVEAFHENPERAMKAAGLSEEHRDLILKRRMKEIIQAVQEEFGDATVAYIVFPHNWPIVFP
jgi:hypothetical protein